MASGVSRQDEEPAQHNAIGNWHPFNRSDPDQSQALALLLAGNLGGVGSEDGSDPQGYDEEYGVGSDANIHNMAGYVAVAPRNGSTSLRHSNFEV